MDAECRCSYFRQQAFTNGFSIVNYRLLMENNALDKAFLTLLPNAKSSTISNSPALWKTDFSLRLNWLSRIIVCFLLAYQLPLYGTAQKISLPGFFGNNMVLQRDKPIKFWGTAPANKVFTIEFASKQKSVTADEDGKWETAFPAMKAGGNYELKINSDSSYTFSNILIGDVWLTSGQSNMDYTFGNTDSVAYDTKENPNIRYYSTPTAISNYPQTDMRRMAWQLCTKENAPSFTAVGYYFAQKINQETGVPIGILHTSWGGTSIKAWISEQGIAKIPEYKYLLDTFLARRNTRNAIDSIAQRNYATAYQNNKKMMAADNGYQQKLPAGEKGNFNWMPINLPGTWQVGSLKDFDGVLWFRKEIELPNDLAQGDYTIQYGRIMGISDMYINGVKVGTNSNYKRGDNKFFLKPDVLHPGKNILVVRVVDSDSAASFYSPKELMFIKSAAGVARPYQTFIDGPWDYTTTLSGKEVDAITQPLDVAPPNTTVSSIYNVKISPLLPLSIKGVLWYQGENDAPVGYFYRTLFPAMINDWRQQFHQGNLPFLFVQLTSYGAVKEVPVENADWPDIRESQAAALALPATDMAVTIDVGNPADIHPHNKKPVGIRLANAALNTVYGKKDFPECPLMKSFTIKGNEVHIRFVNAGSGLMARNGEAIKGFAIAGEDQKFVWADVRIIGKDEIVVSNAAIAHPASVRYAWANSPVAANLINTAGFPAGPFRTDDWQLRTQGKVDDKN